jgi:hypothetical protein
MSNIKKNLANILQNSICHPEKVLYSLANNNGYGGFHLTEVVENKSQIKTAPRKNKHPRLVQGLAKIGKGVEGFTFVGCLDTKCQRMLAIKVAKTGLAHEFKVLTKLQGLTPHVPVPYMTVKCREREMLYEQYVNGGDFGSFLRTYPKLLRPVHIKTIVFQVLWSLYNIQQNVPTFRHNDLHMGNVLLNFDEKVAGGMKYGTKKTKFTVPNIGITAMIGDLGYASMQGFPNPKLNIGLCKFSHGICVDNHSLYDVHFFLTSLYFELTHGVNKTLGSEAVRFIESVFPPNYLSGESNKVKESRLRYNVNHKGIKTLEEILASPYFSVFHRKTNNFAKGILPRAKPQSPPKKVNLSIYRKSPPKKIKTPSPPKKEKTPSPPKKVRKVATGDCGKKARPKDGVGAERLTTDEMVELIKRKGHKVPSDRSRDSLCAVIKEHGLNKPSPVPVVAKAPVSDPKNSIKNFIQAQGIQVIQEPEKKKVPAPVSTAGLPTEAQWRMKKKKLAEELYNKMNKFNGTTYDERMSLADARAYKMIQEMKARGEKP